MYWRSERSKAVPRVAGALLLAVITYLPASSPSSAQTAPATESTGLSTPSEAASQAVVAIGASDVDSQPFNPLAPVNTLGPRETLSDLLTRMEQINDVFSTVLNGYLQSDRLYPSADEQIQMAHARQMAHLASRTMDFEGMPRAIQSPEFRSRLMLTLQDLIARVDLPAAHDIPDAAEMAAQGRTHWRLPGTEIDIARVESGPRVGEWLFSAHTISQLPHWHKEASRLPYQGHAHPALLAFYKDAPTGLSSLLPLRWALALPAPLKFSVLDQPLWRWLGLLLTLLFSGLLYRALLRAVARLDKRAETAGRASLWAHVLLPLAFMLLVYGVREICSHLLRFSEPVYEPLMVFFALMLYASIIWLIWVTARAVSEWVILSTHQKLGSIDGQLIRLSLRFLSVLLSIAVIVEGANRLGLPAYSIVTGLGVGGMAVALAARESLANLMGSFIIMFEKPFSHGQVVRIGNVEGTVEHVGFRSTCIRTRDDSLVSVPSSKIVESSIENLDRRSFRRVKTTMRVGFETAPDKLRRFVESVRELVGAHPGVRERSVRVALNDFADLGLVISLGFSLDVRDSVAESKLREELILAIVESAAALDVRFAAPPSVR